MGIDDDIKNLTSRSKNGCQMKEDLDMYNKNSKLTDIVDKIVFKW